MTLNECFDTFGGDYNGVMGRLVTEERVKKFLKMFVSDTSFDTLCTSMDNGDYETAFRAAHTLKGTCLNLGIGRLGKTASDITEALRGGVNNGADAMMPQIKADYELTIDAINSLD